MKKMFFMLIALYGLCASACADKVNVDIAPPQTYDFQDSKIYNYSYDRVWDAVVKAVGSSYFVLENIEKDSGILSLSFSSQQPKNYIDCGHIKEKNCGVKQAIEEGKISKERYNRFCKIYEELKEKEKRKW